MSTPQGPASQGPTPPDPSSPDPWATGPAGQPYPQPGYTQPNYGQPNYGQPNYAQPGYPPQPYPQPGQQGLPAYAPGAGYGGPPGPGTAPQRPASVSYAFWVWMATMVLGIASSLLLLTGDYLDRVQQQVLANSDLSQTTDDAARTVVVISVIAGVIISLVIYLLFGLKMLHGRNWARIVLTIFGGLAILSGLTGNGATGALGSDVSPPSSSAALGWIQLVLAVIGIVLMYLKTSNHYFRASKEYRARRF